MRDFEKDLKRAAAAYVEKAYGTDGRAEASSSLEDRVGALLSREAHGEPVRGREVSLMKKSRKWTRVIAAAALIALLGAAVAAAPIIRNFINTRTAQENATQLEEVPEGWIGVYTVEDLDAVRDGLGGRYILMEDLAFEEGDFEDGGRFAGGWTPIGTEREPFVGIFNGNGHVIRGLFVTNRRGGAFGGTGRYVGLFGYCRLETETVLRDGADPENAALWDWTAKLSGYIENLGLEDGLVEAAYSGYSTGHVLSVGTVAGYSEFTVGCYSDRMTVNVTVDTDMFEGVDPDTGKETDPEDGVVPRYVDAFLGVGGVAGSGYLADCCRSGAAITVDAEAVCGSDRVYIGGVAGRISACTTSYFHGTIRCGSLPDSGVCRIRADDVPHFLTYPVMTEIMDRLNAASGEEPEVRQRQTLSTRGTDEPEYAEYRFTVPSKKFFAFYCENVAARDLGQDLFTSDAADEIFYQLDPHTKPREYAELSALISKAFPDGDFENFCREAGLKYGCYCVYDLRGDPEPSFEGFDPAIWTGGSLPTLRIFG